VSGLRKSGLMLWSLVHLAPRVPAQPAPVLEATRFLVDACTPVHFGHGAQAVRPAWWDVHSRLVWVLNLFERLERQDQLRHAPRSTG
jgi:hypothetical protein